MEKVLFIINIVFLLIISIQAFIIYKLRTSRLERKSETIVEVLTSIKKEDDFVLDKERDSILIDEYLKEVKSLIDSFDKSRSKLVSFRTRRKFIYDTIMIIPVISKYMDLSIEYDTTSKLLSRKTDRDIMILLTEAYNSFSKEAPEAFNDILLCSLLLSDNK